MKKAVKRAIAVLLTIAILMSVMSITVFAAKDDSIMKLISKGPFASLVSALKDFIEVIKATKAFIDNGMPGLPFGDKT